MTISMYDIYVYCIRIMFVYAYLILCIAVESVVAFTFYFVAKTFYTRAKRPGRNIYICIHAVYYIQQSRMYARRINECKFAVTSLGVKKRSYYMCRNLCFLHA